MAFEPWNDVDIATLIGGLASKLPLPTGQPNGSKFLRDDNSWQVPPSGGGGASATTVEKDLGTTPVFAGKFTVADAGISAASKVLVWQAPGPYTGKGTLADEAAMDRVRCIAVPASGSMVVHWETEGSVAVVPVVASGNPNAVALVPAVAQENRRDGGFEARRIGRVRGNMKFSYVVFS